MVEIMKNELKEFAEMMIKAYKNTTILKEIAKIVPYTGQKAEFFQIGQRTPLPREFFVKSDFSNSTLAGNFAESVVLGEENFIIEILTKLAKENKIGYGEIDEFSNHRIIEVIAKSRNLPTDIFIPIDLPYFQKVHDWVKVGNAKYKSDGLYIMIGNQSVKVHWSTKFAPFNDIVYLNREAWRIIQKTKIDAPKKVDVEYTFGENEPLRIDFGTSKEPDKFDFVFRSVIAIDEGSIDEDSIGVIKLPKLEESKE